MKTVPTPCSPSPRPRGRRLRAGLVASVLALGLLPPAAAMAGGTSVVADCADDGRLDRKYTPAEYADALKNIPTDVDEYTDCRDVIRRGQLGLGGGSGSGDGGGGGSTAGGGTTGAGGTGGTAGGDAGAPGGTGSGLGDYDAALAGATPAERASVDAAVRGSQAGVQIGGRELRPAALGDGELSSLNSLPTPFALVLLLLGLGAVAAAVPPIRTLVRTRLQRTS